MTIIILSGKNILQLKFSDCTLIGCSRSLFPITEGILLIRVIGSHTGSCKLCSSSRLLHSLILDFRCFSSHKFDMGKDLVCIGHKLHAYTETQAYWHSKCGIDHGMVHPRHKMDFILLLLREVTANNAW